MRGGSLLLARCGRSLSLARCGAGSRSPAMREFRDALEKQAGACGKWKSSSAMPGSARSRLVVHDREDREGPFEDAEHLAARWPGATLFATQGLGHRRILRDRDVIGRAAAFVSETRAVP